ncbi:MAG TPA: cysteine desulfurase [Thermoplasmata archaeon]|nr:cysteine desulfurase [Thermoplasmata archaeon]
MTRLGAGVRGRFPALKARKGRIAPAYLDSACMSLVPMSVLESMREYYTDYPGCAGRSVHRFSEEVSLRFEGARARFAEFFGAPGGAPSVVFLRNATEAINLVAHGLDWKPGDSVLLSDQEHNSNLVPWQDLARRRGIRLEFVRLPSDRPFDSERFEAALATRPRLVSLFHASNLDGRCLPAREIVERAHDRGALVLFDGCQAAPHRRVDLGKIGADFYAISSHKMLGPTGTGVLLGAPKPLAELAPSLLGGETVEWSTLSGHALRPPPHRFEAGLQNYAGVLGAAEGLRFLSRVGLDEVEAHDRALNERVTRALEDEPRVQRVGPPEVRDRPSIFAFSLLGVDANDAAFFLDAAQGVMVRSGRHCVHSWYEERGLAATVRASFYLYNTPGDVDRLLAGVEELLSRVPGPSGRPKARPSRSVSGTSARRSARRNRPRPSRRRAAG